MARINTNVPALVAQRHLRRSQSGLELSLERLSSGLRINRGADDPAGLIISENLRAQISSVGQAVDNSQRAINIIATTEGALNEVAALLIDVEALIVEAANTGALSKEEIKANQLQIDNAVKSITRIANTTSFAGLQLVNGSLDYVTSGVATSAVLDLQINAAKFGTRTSIPVSVNVTQSAQQAELQFRNSSITGGSVTLEIRGKDGIATITLGSGTGGQNLANAINEVSDATGVQAVLVSATNPASGVRLRSVEYGDDAFVSVEVLNQGGGTFTTTDVNGNVVRKDNGQDIGGTMNGVNAVGDGLALSINTSTLDLQIALDAAFGLGSTSFAITEGGALFQLGPEVNSNQQENVGVKSVAASRLGNRIVGFLTDIATGGSATITEGKTRESALIVGEAITQVAQLRGRLGAFERNTLQTNINQLTITLENLTSAESAIRDTDFAAETAKLTRNQILQNAGTSVLAIANQTPQNVLALLG
jgi:flagellin